jgi:hypothetical protein
MPADTGAPWNLPYPVGTDRVADGDNAIEALARAIIPPAWIPMTLIGGWQIYAGQETPRYRRWGDRVELRGVAQSTSGSGAGNWIWDVPVGYRPTQDQQLGSITINGYVVKVQRLTVSMSGGNSNKLTVEYDSVPVPASAFVVLTGVYWFIT